MTDPASLAALRALVEQWRADSLDFDVSWTCDTRATLRQCANELAALLAVVPVQEEEPDETCDNDRGWTCKRQYPQSRSSWCEGCLNTLRDPAVPAVVPRKDEP